MKRTEVIEKITNLLKFGTTEQPTKFENAKLADGTIIQWEGELKEGSPIKNKRIQLIMAYSIRRRYSRPAARRTVYKKPAYKKRVYKYKKPVRRYRRLRK